MLCAALAVLFVMDFAWSTVHPNMGAGVTAPPSGLTVIEPDEMGLLLNNLP